MTKARIIRSFFFLEWSLSKCFVELYTTIIVMVVFNSTMGDPLTIESCMRDYFWRAATFVVGHLSTILLQMSAWCCKTRNPFGNWRNWGDNWQSRFWIYNNGFTYIRLSMLLINTRTYKIFCIPSIIISDICKKGWHN